MLDLVRIVQELDNLMNLFKQQFSSVEGRATELKRGRVLPHLSWSSGILKTLLEVYPLADVFPKR